MAQVCWRCAALRAEGDCESARRAEGIKRPVPNLPWAPGAGSGRMVQAVGQSMWAECSLLQSLWEHAGSGHPSCHHSGPC